MCYPPLKGGQGTDTIAIYDNNQKLIIAVDDLRAIRSMILTVGDHEEYANAYEALKVIDRALMTIIDDVQEAIDSIDAALKKEHVQ